MLVQFAPDGVVGLEGRGKGIVGDPQEGLEERVPGLRDEAHGGLLDEGVRYLEYLVAETDVAFRDRAAPWDWEKTSANCSKMMHGVEVRV